MSVIWIEHKGILRKREVYESMPGVYIMHSKGRQYWFRKDRHVLTNFGWNEINGNPRLPQEYFGQIARQLEAFELGKKK